MMVEMETDKKAYSTVFDLEISGILEIWAKKKMLANEDPQPQGQAHGSDP